MDLKFSLSSSYNGLESELKVLLKTVNVKNIEDVSLTVLNKGNKDSLAKFAMSVTGLLQSSQNLLRHAAADLDSLKCEQLQNQSRLLEVQNELSEKKSDQLEAVKSTVDDKLTTWASIVKQNSSTSQAVTQKEMKKAFKSALKDNDREYNVIMFNVEEELEGGDSSEKYNYDKAADILNNVNSFDGDFATERIGSPVQEKNRPLKVRFEYKSSAFDILACSKNLKDSDNYHMVFIEPDRSREERTEHRKLVQQLKLKRSDNPNKRFYIWNKTICTAD